MDLQQLFGPGYAGYLYGRDSAKANEMQALQGMGMLSQMQRQAEQNKLLEQQIKIAEVQAQKAAALQDVQQNAIRQAMTRMQGGQVAPTGNVGMLREPDPMTGQGGIALPEMGAVQSQAGFPFAPAEIGLLGMAGVPGMDTMLKAYTASQPQIDFVNGIAVDKRTVKPGTSLPQTNQQGFSTVTVQDPTSPTGYRTMPNPGGESTYAVQQDVAERTRARYDPVTIPPTAPDQPPRMVSRLDALGGSAAPAAPAPQPTPNAVADLQEALAVEQSMLAQAKRAGDINGAARAQSNITRLNQELERWNQGGAPTASRGTVMGMSPNASAQVKGNEGAAGAINEGQAKIFNDQYAQALKSAQALPVIEQAKSALDSGAITGFGADFRLNFGRALALAGFNESKNEAENTQVFAATMARQVLGIISSLGAGSGISDADREYAANIVGGKINLEPGAMRRLIDISERAIRSQVGWVNERASKYRSIPGVTSVDPIRINANVQDAINASSSNVIRYGPTGARQGSGGGSVIRFDAQGRRIQ